MKSIPATKFKQQCLSILDHIGSDGLVITKHGKAVAKLIPVGRQSEGLIGSLRRKITIKGDVRSTGLGWNAES